MCSNANSKRAKYNENIYGPEVLVGNWFELRLADQIDKRAIVPAITGRSSCFDYPSTYNGDYMRSEPFKPTDETINEAMEQKLISYANKIKSQRGHICMFHGNQFLNNFVTTTDISYRIIPQLVHQNRLYQKREAVPAKFDFYGNYGNATQTGLRAWYACEARHQPRLDMSTMKSEYLKQNVSPFVRAKGLKSQEPIFPNYNTLGFCKFK